MVGQMILDTRDKKSVPATLPEPWRNPAKIIPRLDHRGRVRFTYRTIRVDVSQSGTVRFYQRSEFGENKIAFLRELYEDAAFLKLLSDSIIIAYWGNLKNLKKGKYRGTH